MHKKRLRRTAAVIGLLIGVAGAVQVVGPPSAAAAVSGAVVIQAASAFDGHPEKTATAVCPLGKRVIGGGGQTINLDDRIMLTRLEPVHGAAEDSFVATGRADRVGTSNPWSVQAYAICADPLPGLTIVTATTRGSDLIMAANARCPTGAVLVGTGGRIRSGIDGVQILKLLPFNSSMQVPANGTAAHGVNVQGIENFPVAGDWRVTAYAVCADAAVGAQVFSDDSTIDDESFHLARAFCAIGTVTGTGADNLGFGDVNLETVRPRSNLTSVDVRANKVGPNWRIWGVRAFAICAP